MYLNHVALEVGDIEAALALYGQLFDFELRSKSDSMAFIDLGDQFIAFQKGRTQSADDGRHFGLVVDNKEAARKAMVDAGRLESLTRLPREYSLTQRIDDLRGRAYAHLTFNLSIGAP
jgi:catechol 2,3-dioxygenase-like lactoylglutathione lyase family enzyme